MTVVAFEVVIGSSKQTDRERERDRERKRERHTSILKRKRQTKRTNKKEIQNVTNKSALFSHASIRTTRTRTKMSLIPRGFWNPFVGEQRAGAAGPLSGACIDDNPLSAFLFSYLSFFFRVFFSQAVVVLFERARDRKNKAHHFPNNGEKDRREERFLHIAFRRCDHHP